MQVVACWPRRKVLDAGPITVLMSFIVLPVDLLVGRHRPRAVESANVDALRRAVEREGGNWLTADVEGAVDMEDVVAALKSTLPIPDWCGLNWDAVFDVWQETFDEVPDSTIVCMRGFGALLHRRPHLALASLLQLDDLYESYRPHHKQLEFVLLSERWR